MLLYNGRNCGKLWVDTAIGIGRKLSVSGAYLCRCIYTCVYIGIYTCAHIRVFAINLANSPRFVSCDSTGQKP